MLNAENNRFPFSAELFIFCKEILTLKKYGQKVTDQDVGALLGFDPADCTHWKYGRKGIRSIQSIQQLAQCLDVDSRFLMDIATGRELAADALNEYKGYGNFEIDPAERSILLEEVMHFLQIAQVKSFPVLLPELVAVIPHVSLISQDMHDNDLRVSFENGQTILFWNSQRKMGASLRFRMTNELSKIILNKEHMQAQLGTNHTENHQNICTMFLLIPPHLLQQVCSQCDPGQDTIQQIAQKFWVSRTLVNLRLKDFLTYRS